jgi:hypothetical protein
VANDQLVVALPPLNDSGYAGPAILTPNGDRTEGNVYLFGEVDGVIDTWEAAPTGTPAATPGTWVRGRTLASRGHGVRPER